MKIYCIGDRIIMKSALTLEELQTVEKNSPESLRLYKNERGEMVYYVSTMGSAGVESGGITFAGADVGDGKAFLVMPIPVLNGRSVTEVIADEYGSAIANVNMIEENARDALKAIKEIREQAKEMITVIDASPNSEVEVDFE